MSEEKKVLKYINPKFDGNRIWMALQKTAKKMQQQAVESVGYEHLRQAMMSN